MCGLIITWYPDLSQFPSGNVWDGYMDWSPTRRQEEASIPSPEWPKSQLSFWSAECTVQRCAKCTLFVWHTNFSNDTKYTNETKHQNSKAQHSRSAFESPVESNSAHRCDPMATDRRLWFPEPGRKGDGLEDKILKFQSWGFDLNVFESCTNIFSMYQIYILQSYVQYVQTYQSSIRPFRLFNLKKVSTAHHVHRLFPFEVDSVQEFCPENSDRRISVLFRSFSFLHFYSRALGASFCFSKLDCVTVFVFSPQQNAHTLKLICLVFRVRLLTFACFEGAEGPHPAAASANCSRRLSLQGPTCRDG